MKLPLGLGWNRYACRRRKRQPRKKRSFPIEIPIGAQARPRQDRESHVHPAFPLPLLILALFPFPYRNVRCKEAFAPGGQTAAAETDDCVKERTYANEMWERARGRKKERCSLCEERLRRRIPYGPLPPARLINDASLPSPSSAVEENRLSLCHPTSLPLPLD